MVMSYGASINQTTILVIIMIILISYTCYLHYVYGRGLINNLLYGWYGADPVFCDKADLESIILYLDRDNYGYILIKGADQSILLNESFKYVLKPDSIGGINVLNTFTIIFDSLDYDDYFPSTQKLEFQPLTQRIRLYDPNTDLTHAVLYKNNSVSDMMDLVPPDS